jgi:hypothetical protein
METLLGCDGMRAGDEHIHFSNFPLAIKFKAIFRVDNGGKTTVTQYLYVLLNLK